MTRGGIVFDLDGTLIDSAPDIHATTNAILAEEGLPALDFATVKGFIGHGLPNLVARVLHSVGRGGDALLLADFVARFEARYTSAVTLTNPYDGVRAALGDLASRGHPLGICTNKPQAPARAILAHLGLADFFAVIIGGDSLNGIRKPDPAPLRAAFAALGAPALLFVGDSEVDCDTAQTAAVPMALFTGGYRHSAVEVLVHHAAFDHFEQLAAIASALDASAGRV